MTSLDAVPQNAISLGRRSLLIQIGKYNGRLDDKEVAIGIALSDGLHVQVQLRSAAWAESTKPSRSS